MPEYDFSHCMYCKRIFNEILGNENVTADIESIEDEE